MKRLTSLLIAMIAVAFAMEINAGPDSYKVRTRAANPQIYQTKPDPFKQVGDSKMYYSIAMRYFWNSEDEYTANPGDQYGVSLLGEIDGVYYGCTYGDTRRYNGIGAGFLAALKVDENDAQFMNVESGMVNNGDNSSNHGVTMTARLEPHGEVAAKIIYTLTNNNEKAVTVSAGVYGDIMIGNNDYAPLERLVHEGDTYGLKMKQSLEDGAPLFCALFGEGVTGVTPVDEYWFGFFDHNWSPEQVVGNVYSKIRGTETHWVWDGPISGHNEETPIYDEHYLVEDGGYDSGAGFCWKNKRIEAFESIELSYIISVGEIEYEEPFVPGDDRFEYTVEAYDFEGWNDLSVAHPAHVFGYYEHPYGQNGFIEYQVDGMRSWTRIPTELVSGQEFDLPFDMFFNADVTTTHTLELRFNDGLDNITPMDGLSWTDVRSFNIEGIEDRVYTGEPQTFEVTVGEETFTIGQNGEYVEPGTYDYSIEGDFDQNTIGMNTVEFKIDKAQSEIEYTIPEDCVYDGEAHAATVELVKGDGELTVTYVDTKTGESSTEAPIEPGTYSVVVTVTETDRYYGLEETIGTFTIGKAQSEITYTVPEDCVYDGEAHAATAELVKGDGELTITYVNTETGETSTEAPVVPGTYDVVVTVTETDHYYGLEQTVGTFTIKKAPCVFDVIVPEDVEHDGEGHPATVIVTQGGEPIVTYLNTKTDVISADDPVDIGEYYVIVEIPETDLYEGLPSTMFGPFEIYSGTTGLQEIGAARESDNAWYTIQGIRVPAPTAPGIYIHNGKKYILK